MTKKIKVILIVVAAALVFAIAGGLIIHFVKADKGGGTEADSTLMAKVDECVLQDSIAFYGDGVAENLIEPMSLSTYATSSSNEQVVSGNSTTLTLKLTSNVLSEVMLEKVNVPVTWKLEFINPNSTWASGKSVTNYVTVTPNSDFTRTVTVKNIAPFGEQIRLTAKLTNDSSKTASSVIDYVKRVDGGFSELSCNTDFGDDLAIWGTIYSDEAVGTKYGDIKAASSTIELESGFVSLLKSYLKFDITVTSYSLSKDKIQTYADYHKTYKKYSIGIIAVNEQGKEVAMDYSHFISNWGSLSEAQKIAVKYAWYVAYQDFGDNASVDVIWDFIYGDKVITSLTGNMWCYISGESEGSDLSVDSSLVNIVF